MKSLRFSMAAEATKYFINGVWMFFSAHYIQKSVVILNSLQRQKYIYCALQSLDSKTRDIRFYKELEKDWALFETKRTPQKEHNSQTYFKFWYSV